MFKPLVYLAGPYTKGDPSINVHCQCRLFDTLLAQRIVIPIAPLWSHFQHGMFPRPYEDWLQHDLEVIARCDALLRQDAVHEGLGYSQSESSGADREMEFASANGVQVFQSVDDLYEWVNYRNGNH